MNTQPLLSSAQLAAEYIKQKRPLFSPKVGIVLGSGLGEFANQLEEAQITPYEALNGFPKVSIHGHTGLLVTGYLSKVGIVCLQGRIHNYEGLHNETVKTYVRCLKLLGCEYFIATNASGSLRKEMGIGELMLVTDHINFQPDNPLIGPNDDAFGPRFFALDNAYDLTMRNNLLAIAKQEKIVLHQGVYISVLGPNFETAAEIKAFRLLGADAIGMSTVPEVLVANHCGLKVAAIATITNFATGLNDCVHCHDSVVLSASTSIKNLTRLLSQFIAGLISD